VCCCTQCGEQTGGVRSLCAVAGLQFCWGHRDIAGGLPQQECCDGQVEEEQVRRVRRGNCPFM